MRIFVYHHQAFTFAKLIINFIEQKLSHFHTEERAHYHFLLLPTLTVSFSTLSLTLATTSVSLQYSLFVGPLNIYLPLPSSTVFFYRNTSAYFKQKPHHRHRRHFKPQLINKFSFKVRLCKVLNPSAK